MSNETVTYTLESVLKEIKDSIKEVNQKIDTFQQDVNQKFDSLQKDFNQKFDSLQRDFNQKIDTLQQDVNQKFDKIDERLTKLEVGQAKLTEKVDGMDRKGGRNPKKSSLDVNYPFRRSDWNSSVALFLFWQSLEILP